MLRKGKGNDKDSLSNGLQPISTPLSGPAVHVVALQAHYKAKTHPRERTEASNGSLPLQFNVVKHNSVDVVEERNMIAMLNY